MVAQTTPHLPVQTVLFQMINDLYTLQSIMCVSVVFCLTGISVKKSFLIETHFTESRCDECVFLCVFVCVCVCVCVCLFCFDFAVQVVYLCCPYFQLTASSVLNPGLHLSDKLRLLFIQKGGT